MAKLSVGRILINEATAFCGACRQPEPDLVMNDPDSVRAYIHAGRESGVMAPTYLFHTAHVCELIRPGDVVLDLACGPATQLVQVARIRPDASFIGVDLSVTMLDRAREYIQSSQVDNVTLQRADITALKPITDGRVSVVMSSMSLHHLPTLDLLRKTMEQVQRVLTNDGAVYLGDFGRLRSARTMELFAHQYDDRQPPEFTTDYVNSLRAAFSVAEFGQAMQPITGRAQLYRMFPIPFLVAIKSPRHGTPPADAAEKIRRIRSSFNADQERDLCAMLRFFRFGGLKTPLLA